MPRALGPVLALLVCFETASGFIPSLISLRPRFDGSSPLASRPKGALSCAFLPQHQDGEPGSKNRVRSLRGTHLALTMTAASAFDSSAQTALAAERYVVFTRLRMRKNGGLRWEKRWADRKSTLSEMDGFRFFSMLRRCKDMPNLFAADGVVTSDPARTPDYMSMTWWESKQTFSAWGSSGAFQDSHGKGFIGWVSLILWALQVLKGPPAPAKWEGLLPLSVPGGSSPIQPKDRSQAGAALLPAECFVAMLRYHVPAGKEADFELGWEERRGREEGAEGFVASTMLRRDMEGKEGGGGAFAEEDRLNYAACSVWKAREDCVRWYQSAGNSAWEAAWWGDAGAGQLEASAEQGPVATFWEGLLAEQSATGA